MLVPNMLYPSRPWHFLSLTMAAWLTEAQVVVGLFFCFCFLPPAPHNMIDSGKTPIYDISVFPHLANYKRNRSDISVFNESKNWKTTFDAHQCSIGALQASSFIRQDHKTTKPAVFFWKTTLFIYSTYILIFIVTSVDP